MQTQTKEKRRDTEPRSIRCLRAIESFQGGRLRFASKLNVSRTTVAQWVHYNKIPSDRVLEIVQLGERKFSAEELLGLHD